MPDKEWFTQKEISDNLGVPYPKVQAAVRALRRMNVIMTTPDPRDERYTLVHQSAIAKISEYLRLNVKPGDIA